MRQPRKLPMNFAEVLAFVKACYHSYDGRSETSVKKVMKEMNLTCLEDNETINDMPEISKLDVSVVEPEHSLEEK